MRHKKGGLPVRDRYGILAIVLALGVMLTLPLSAKGSQLEGDEPVASDVTGGDAKPGETAGGPSEGAPADDGKEPSGEQQPAPGEKKDDDPDGDKEPAEGNDEKKDGEDGKQDSERAPGTDNPGNGSPAEGKGGGDESQDKENQNKDKENQNKEAQENKENNEGTSDKAGIVPTVRTSADGNLVSRVLVNSLNYMSQHGGDDEEVELPSLAEYPLDPHELPWYEGSSRVRFLNTDEIGESYLVYRDSFLLVPAKEAEGHSVTYSEDGRTAYVSPAIDAKSLDGKSGIVLLGDNIGLDEVLVFDGTPTVSGDGTLVARIKDSSSIYLSELFSDGKFEVTSQASPRLLRSFAKGGTRGWLSKHMEGTNWEGDLDNFAPGDLGASLEMNPWKLRFGLRLHIECEVDFDITSTGATGERETKDIASVPIDVDPFNIEVAYQLQVEFDEHPVHIKGHMSSDMDYIISTRGADIENFRTPVDFETFELKNPERDANKAIELYIGSQFSVDCGILEFKIDLWVTEVKIGPVLKLSQHSMGGVSVTACLERNSFSATSPDRTLDRLHTCCDQGAAGCLSILSTETAKQEITFEINLYFKKFPFTLWDDGEKTIDTKEQHQSLTKNEDELQDGICPHVLFNVPVAVWRVGPADNPSQSAGDGLSVSLNDLSGISDLTERKLAQGTTDGSGQTSIFLPFVEGKKNLITASGTLGDVPVRGSAPQPAPMQRGGNETTNIVLDSAELAQLRITKKWNVDLEGHELPEKVQMLVLRKEIDNAAPTPGDGTDGGGTRMVPYDIVDVSPSGEDRTTWEETPEYPKYWLGDTGSEGLYAYEYAVRELKRGYSPNDFVGPGASTSYFPDSYLTDPTLEPETLASRREDVLRSVVESPDESTGSAPTMSCAIPLYTTQGEVVPEHEATYWVTYESDVTADGFHFTVTNTAMQQVHVSKHWVVKNGTPIPDSVYLTAMWRPEDGWSQIADAQGIPNTWVPVVNPIEGPTTTLSNLMMDGMMNIVDLHGIDDVPIAIAKVTPQGYNVWRVDYCLPKYRNGVPMRVLGAELDTTCITNLLSYGFDVDEQVSVKTPEGFPTSLPGLARGSSDTFQFAYVVNADTDPMHTIGGVKTWENGTIYGTPEWLKIEVWDDTDDDLPAKVGETTLYKADNAKSDIWPWTLYDPDLNPNRTYRLIEVYPNGYTDASNWVPEVIDHDIDNHYVGENDTKVRIKVQFDKQCPPNNPESQGVELDLRDENGQVIQHLTATREDARNYSVEVPGRFANNRDFAHFTIKETNLSVFKSGYDWADADLTYGGYQDFYSEPVQSFELGYKGAPDTPVWTYTVTNLAQGEMHLPTDKIWDDGDSPDRPDSVRVTLYQDGVAVNTKDITAGWPGEWYTAMQNDQNGTKLDPPLLRFDPDDGHFYTYTLTEEHVDGYWTEITQSVENAYVLAFKVKNTLIGDRGVTLRGTVHWEGDTGKEHLRPETVHIVAICEGDPVASVDVPVSDGTWEVRDMPRYAKDGSLLKYSILESHVDGYKTYYTMPPSYDEAENAYTLDLTNKLTGYFPLTVKKVIEGAKESESIEQEFEFSVEPVDDIAAVDWGFPTPVGWPENLKIKGQGEGQFEFLIDQDGLYLYRLYEVKGTNGLYTYDEEVRSVLIAATRGADDMMEFQCWVGPEGKISFDLASTTTPGSGDDNQDPAPTPGDDNQDPAPTPGGGDGNQDPAPTPGNDNQDPAPTPGDDNQDPAPTPGGDDTTGGETTDPDGSSTDSGETSDDWVDTDDVKKTDTVTFTNKGGRSYSVKKEWDFKGKEETKPASIKAQLQRKDKKDDGTSEWVAVETIELTEASGWQGKFSPVHPDATDIAEAQDDGDDGQGVPNDPPDGTAGSPGDQQDLPSHWDVDPDGAIVDAMDRRYRVRELTDDGSAVLAEDDEDNEEHEKQGMVVTVTKDGEERQVGFFATYKHPSDAATGDDSTTGGNGTTGDNSATGDNGNGTATGNETQDSSETIITNTLGKLFTVEKKWEIDAENTDKPSSIKVQLQKKEKKDDGDGNGGGDGGQSGQGNGDDDKEKWEKFDEIEIGDEGSWKGHFKLVELEEKDEDYRIRELNKEGKPVLDKEDKDLEGDDDEKEKYVPTVTYEAGDHDTKYLVSYKVDDEKPQHTEITNKAVMDVSLYKRWLMFGDAKKPDSVYLMLLGRAKAAEGEDAVPYLPVKDVLYGDKFDVGSLEELVGIKSQMESVSEIVADGDKEAFNNNIEDFLDEQGMNLKLAVKKVSSEKDDYDKEWHAQFGVAKYDDAGKEREFVGAELVTGLMKIGTDVMTGTDFPVMIQPIPEVYFTVFGYTFNIFEDWELTGNVINTWFDGNIDPDNPDPPNPPNPPVPPVPPVPPLPPVPPVPPVPIPPVPTPPTPPVPDPDPSDPESIGQPVIGSKFWVGDDEDERPTEVKIHVYAQDGDNKWEVRGSPVTAKASNDWAWMLYLPPGDPAIGKKITVEEEVPDGYTARYSGYDIINTKIPSGKKTVRGAKTWNDADDQDGKRPDSITIRLLADGVEVAHKTVTADDGWKWEFKDMPIEKDGHKIAYTVSEDAVDGYDTHYEGTSVTNTHSPETVKIHVSKVWDDNGNQDDLRPDKVTVRLRIDGTTVATQELSESNNWEHTFGEGDEKLAKYWEGKEIAYSLTEDPVTEYSTTINEKSTDGFYKDYEVKNSCTPNKVQVHVTKVWSDEDDCDGIRPDSVTARLLDGGQETGIEVVLSEANGWEATFDDLDYKRGGTPVAYSVAEVTDGTITGTDGSGTYGFEVYKDTDGDYSYGILNYHTPETVTVDGSKTWNDKDDKRGKRPSAIVVNLLADGKKVASKTVTEQDGWAWEFPGLRKYANGKEISYTIEESEVGGYEAKVDGHDVTNTPLPEPTKYRVEFYYQVRGRYPSKPDETEEREGMEGQSVRVTTDDLTAKRDRYEFDKDAGNVLDGTIPDEGTLVLKVHFQPSYVITYDPNGGRFADGGESPVDESHHYGDAISIRDAPTRDGYEFEYWKGSAYQPGDEYVVTGDHTFVAQWSKAPSPSIPDTHDDPKNPRKGGMPSLGDDLKIVFGCVAVAAVALVVVLVLKRRNGDD